ncbi:hypothetical protein SUGI_0574540 [Cryptomeria japonica]|nr:hypothetical protein SUGI_0574540 [Cryptomeria japonica]
MMSLLDVLYSSAEYIPSSTRNIPLMLRQLSVLACRLFSCLLRTAEDMRETYIRRSDLQYHAWVGYNGRRDNIPWNNLTVASLLP